MTPVSEVIPSEALGRNQKNLYRRDAEKKKAEKKIIEEFCGNLSSLFFDHSPCCSIR
jgi:hypothetical protein